MSETEGSDTLLDTEKQKKSRRLCAVAHNRRLLVTIGRDGGRVVYILL